MIQTFGVEGAMRGPQIVMDDGGSAFMLNDVQTRFLRDDSCVWDASYAMYSVMEVCVRVGRCAAF